MQHWEEIKGQTQTMLEKLLDISQLTWEHLGKPLDTLEDAAGKREDRGLLPQQPDLN